MSAVPVVWCSDPNSSEKKQPFALQGIQLQGNITEKHVLAMKELINAASEGRLLLPTDGAIVLLDCGLSIGSMVIEGKAGKEAAAEAASNDGDNHKSILPCRRAAGPPAASNCVPSSPADGAQDCNNRNSSSSNSSDESDRVATSVRERGRIEAAEKLRVMLERQLDGRPADIDPEQQPNETERREDVDDRLSGGIDFSAVDEERPDVSGHREQEDQEQNGAAMERLVTAGPELLYEFLCCAKCMNDPTSSCSNLPNHRTRSLTALNNSSKLLSRVLNGRAKARLYCDPVYSISNLYFKRFINYKIAKSRRPVMRRSSSRSDRSCGAQGGDMPGGLSTAPDGGGGSNKKKHFAEGSPVYATVNKKLKLKSRLDALRRSGHIRESGAGVRRLRGERTRASPDTVAMPLPEIFITGTSGTASKPAGAGASSRKTSFDSTCTVSSMDSGFIDQQQRQQLKQQLQQLHQQKTTAEGEGAGGGDQQPVLVTGVGASEPEEDDGSDRLNDLSRVQIKECLVTQSRNRRKSYEEFKSLFRQEVAAAAAPVAEVPGRTSNPAGLPVPSADEKESVKARRKSYEEFKALVKICDTSFSSLKTTAEEEPEREQREGEEGKPPVTEKDTRTPNRPDATLTTTGGNTCASVGNLFKMRRKNSRRLSLKKPATVGGGEVQRSASGREVVKGSTIYDILRSDRKLSAPASPLIKDLGQLALTRTADEIYRKNYKIYDKLISYGSKAYKRYDKYMTYGTIYEILHRKSDAAEDVFLRKRALSEKYAKRKVGTSGASPYGSVKLGTIYDILQGKQLQIDAAGGRKKSAPGPDETPATLSTIYDIIHSKKATDPSSPKDKTGKNRFLVKKITEEELQLSNENDRNELNLKEASKGVPEGVAASVTKSSAGVAPADGGPPSPDYTTPKSMGQARKPVRARRFSNILSYSSNSQKSPPAGAAANTASATVEESPRLDSPRLKQIAASDEDLYKSATAKLRAAQQQVQRHQLSVDELYARIGKMRKSATVSTALCTKIDEVVGDEGDQAVDATVKVLQPHQPTRQRHQLMVPERSADQVQPGPIFKSNSLDMLAPKKLSRTARWSKQMHEAASGLSGPIRKLSPLIMPMKKGSGFGSGEQKKSTRRLSEFTRGEFLNEKP
uniref:Uncharacterized protein n=1 Tax=Anopheles farauti TaxID=69004 RepID=A0A182QNE2_9DIPT